MTWKEFKKEVDRQIKEQGESPRKIELDYIDWPCSYSDDKVEVITMENGKMVITS